MNKNKRKAFGVLLIAGALSIASWFHLTSSQQDSEAAWPKSGKPNILLIVTDDQRWDQLGLVQAEQGQNALFPFLKTPHLDALANDGIRFRNAFVTTSLCSPSRSSILTGRFAHAHGVIDNYTPASDQPNWASMLKDSGYTTAYFGKWHHGRQLERPGFEYVATFRGQGHYKGTRFFIGESGARKPLDTRGYVDSHSVNYFSEYLDTPRDKPFAAVIGLKAVHQPFTPMDEHAGSYRNKKISRAPNWSSAPPWSSYKNEPPRRRTYRNFWNDILETMLGLDKNIGLIMDALETHGLRENTVVIFTSDNGYYLGEHLLGDKRSAYEESMRVPMIISYPREITAGTQSQELVLNIDLAPTILDLAAVSPASPMHGKSLRPLFSDSAAPWRDAILYEHWELPYDTEKWPDKPNKQGALNVLRTPTILAVRTREHKLITYPENAYESELFDLREDPYETRNLADAAEYSELRSQMCDKLAALLEEYQYSYLWPIGQWNSRSTYPLKDASPYNQIDTSTTGYALKKC
ncbi:MAG: arylsulfatase [Halioglobus sp.]|nr:arylsulfatase [Halioglobus sp.]